MKVTVKRIQDDGRPVWQVRFWRMGKYVRRQFQSRDLAIKFRDEVDVSGKATSLDSIGHLDRIAVMEAYTRAKGAGYSLLEACEAFESIRRSSRSQTVVESVRLFLTSKAGKGLRPRSLQNLSDRLKVFVSEFHDRSIADVSKSDIERFIGDRGGSPRSKINWMLVVGNLFNWAIRQGYSTSNPVTSMERPLVDSAQPRVMTPAEARELMGRVRLKTPSLVPYVALSLFAGLRNSEAMRLSIDDVDVAQLVVRVESGKAKTRARRVVSMQPNLKAWLSIGGDIPPRNLRRLWPKVRPDWFVVDCMRRTFCSYHLAAFGSASRTALEAGHSESTLFRHYRGVVTPAEAVEFWAIAP